MASRRGSAVLSPNLGVYYDRPALAIDARAMSDCLNVRVKDGKIQRDNMGWGPFPDAAAALNLTHPVMGIDNFFPRAGGQFLIFCTTKDIYEYVEASKTVAFLTPRYETGTVAVTNASTTVTGTSTVWTTNVKAGDFIFVGATGQRDPAAAWYEVATVVSNTELTLAVAYAGSTASGQAYAARKVFTGSIRDPWTFETFPNAIDVEGTDGDRWYATNGRDKVVAWDGTATQIYFPAIGLDNARWIRRIGNLMVYGNITVSAENRPFSIRTSDIAKPEDTSGGFAAELVVHDGVDPLLTSVPLGDTLVIYGERSITLAQFVGGALVFVFRRAIAGIGPLSGRAVADFGDFHEFLGGDAQYRFDGIRVDEIGWQVWRDVLRRYSPQRVDMAFSHFDEENGEVLWIVPLNTDADADDGPPERGFPEHYLEQVGNEAPTPFTVRDLPFTAAGFFERELTLTWDQMTQTWEEVNFRWNDRFLQGAFPFNLMGDNAGNVFVLNALDSKNGGSILSFARFGRRQLGDIRRKGTVRRIYPFTEPVEGNLDVRLHLARDPAGITTLAGPFPFDMRSSTVNHFVSPLRTGRYLEVEFRREGTGAPFFLSGYDLDVVSAGER